MEATNNTNMNTAMTNTISTKKYKNERPTWGLRNIVSLTEKILKPIKKKKGFIENKLAVDWHTIVGQELATQTAPEKVISSRGKDKEETICIIKVASGAAAVLLQTQTPIILERINAFLGTTTCKAIRIKQGSLLPITLNTPQLKTMPLDEDKLTISRESVTEIGDSALCDALSRLGARLMDRS